MNDTNDVMMRLFFEIHNDMPRQGPGDPGSTRRAFSMLRDLPERPDILDVGCGPGAQTLDLADLSDGSIVAVDLHPPFLEQLAAEVDRRGLGDRIRWLEKNMEQLDFPPGSFDLIWSEGAIYIMGFERGLCEWRPLLRTGGAVAVTEATWLRSDPPAELAEFWNEGYPAMQDVEANLATIRAAGYRPLGHFTLPDSSWWTDYYHPLEKRLETFGRRHRDDETAMQVLEMERREIAFFQKYSEYYGYVFYVMERAD